MGLRYGEILMKHRILPLLFRNGDPKWARLFLQFSNKR